MPRDGARAGRKLGVAKVGEGGVEAIERTTIGQSGHVGRESSGQSAQGTFQLYRFERRCAELSAQDVGQFTQRVRLRF